ncbi:MAG TPA: carboxypeptidase-like regulatory domain-containing protein, partial [Bacteroidia bacterium]|nr:carboxypeptidase-like regulatory domain-containing protein [Bacteroidia bacterium]
MKRLFVLFFLITFSAQAQNLKQTVRGVVLDKQTQSPIPGAVITILNSSPLKVASSDEDGKFRIDSVPIGRW